MATTKKPILKAVPGSNKPNLRPSRELLEQENEDSKREVWETYDLLVLSNEIQTKANAYVKGVEEVWKTVVDERTRVMNNLKEGARYISKHEFYKNKKLSTPTTNIHTLEVGDAIGSEIEEATAQLPTGLVPESEGE